MTATAIVLALFLIAACARNRQLRRRLVAVEVARELGMGDDGLLTELEVRAISSPLAKRLLIAATASGTVANPTTADAPVIEDWKHNPKASTPSLEHWKLFVKDMGMEADDCGRAVCLDRWLEAGIRFTTYEQVATAAMFQGDEWRDAARAAFIRAAAAEKKPKATQ